MIRYALLAAGSGAWILDATMDLINTGKRVVRTKKGDLLLEGLKIRPTTTTVRTYGTKKGLSCVTVAITAKIHYFGVLNTKESENA